MLSQFSSATLVGFSGSRAPSSESLAAVQSAIASLALGTCVVVGCARGVDECVRSLCPQAQVFRAESFGTGKSAFARRSVACVQSVAVPGGLWVSFPASPCPPGLVPSASSSKCFCGAGSGTWASLAFAVGLGVPCLVFLPAGVSAPAGWGLSSLGGGWFSVALVAAQLSLF